MRKVKIATLNVGNMIGRSGEIAQLIRKKSLQVVCVQETKLKGSKAREIGAGYKLYYHGEESKRNGIGIIVLCEELKEGVLAVTRPCDRVMRIKFEIEGKVWHIISCYAPQTRCPQDEKETFWEHMYSEMQTVTRSDRVVVAGGIDMPGTVGSGDTLQTFHQNHEH